MRRSLAQSKLATLAVTSLTAVMLAWAAGAARPSAQAGTTPPGGATSTKSGAAKPAGGGAVARGKYLVTAMGCHDCHTPWHMGANGPEPDMTQALSGHPASMTLPPPPQPSGPWIASFAATNTAWSGPWGISYTANLTPDRDTGLGAWTEQQFLDAIRSGRHQGRGRPILPPMPWQWFKSLNDADLKAMFAYLKTVPPISNKVPDPVIAPPPSSK
jgi:hypothetical protein